MRSTGQLRALLSLLLAVLSGLMINVGSQANAQDPASLNAQAKLLSGDLLDGSLVGISVDSIEMDLNGDKRSIPISEVEYVSFSQKSPAPLSVPMVRLVDGSQLNVAEVTLSENQLNCKLGNIDRVKINSRNIVGISWNDGVGDGKELEDILLANDRSSDALIVYRDDAFSAIEGVVRSLESDAVEFSVGDRTAKVKLEKLQAMTFYHAVVREFDQPMAKCELLSGGKLNLRKLAVNQEEGRPTFTLTTQAGVALNVSPSNIAKIQFGIPSTAQLSDFSPTTNDWRPLLASPLVVEQLRAFRLAQRNVSFDDAPLTLEWHDGTEQKRQTRKTYRSGFAISGGGKLAFALNRQYKRLQAKVGFAPTAHPAGHVTIKVTVDGEQRFHQAIQKRTLNLPLQLDLDVTDCQRLVIEVGYADGQSVGDQIHLVDTSLTR